ncbi:MAG: extracellular solute-binding protein [Nitrospinota bacterium]|nr:MAG: extracellular solute-binding protein [Nitrospinota bacterium]
MKKHALLGLVLALLVLLATLPAAAQDVMELARKEGKVVWYSSIALPIAQELCNLFNSKNLGIECVLHRSGSGKLFRRLLQEARAGIYNADILHTSNIGHFVTLRKEKAIIPYRPKGTERFDPNFLEKDGYWTILRASVYIPAYNTTKVKPEEVPQSWLDFLDPKWKGKLVNAHPSYSGFVSVGMAALVKLFGWEFFDKLAAQKPRIVQSAVDATTFVVRGEALMSAGGTGYQTFDAIQRGEPIQYVYPKEGVPFIASPQAILAKAPHPNAAKVFSDWLFSKEAQQVLANHGLYVGHPDVQYPPSLKPLKDLKLIILTPEEAVKMRKPVREAFRKKFGV